MNTVLYRTGVFMGQTKKLELTSSMEELNRLSAFVDELAADWAIPNAAMFNINLALDELVSNIIKYGYGESGHPVFIEFGLDSGMIGITLEDSGSAFNPLDTPAPDIHESLEDRKVGGLGIHFVRNIVNDIQYERKDDKNRLHLKISVDSANS